MVLGGDGWNGALLVGRVRGVKRHPAEGTFGNVCFFCVCSFFITLHIILLKSECVLHLMGIFNAPPQLLSGRRAHGEFVKDGELRPEGLRN